MPMNSIGTKRVLAALCALFGFACLSGIVAGCGSDDGRDAYIRSLKLKPKEIAPVDSIDLEALEVYFATRLIKRGDWFLMQDFPVRTHLVTAVNPARGEVLRFIPLGRGFGEIARSNPIYNTGGLFTVVDFESNTVVSMDVEESLKRREAVLDTISHFRESGHFMTRPRHCRDGFIVSSYEDASYWYRLVDSTGRELSTIPPIGSGLLYNEKHPALMMTNSYFAISPSGDKICCASMHQTALSFAWIEEGRLVEKCRVEIPSELRDPETFRGAWADDERVCLLYAGEDFVPPGTEADWLIMYDWEGRPQQCYHLAHPVWSPAVEGNRVYSLSVDPDCKIYVYQLD